MCIKGSSYEPIEEAKEQRSPRRMIIPEFDLSQIEIFKATCSDIGSS